MKCWIALVAAMLLNANANLMMKMGMVRHQQATALLPQPGLAAQVSALSRNWVLMLGLFCFATNVILYTFALREIKISLAYPIMVGCGFAIIALVAWSAPSLHETLSPTQWAGIALILVGVVLVAQQQKVAG